MPVHSFFAPRPRRSPAALVALDFGLPVRAPLPQPTLFSGAEDLSLRELTSELALMVSELRVRSFALRHELEQVTTALLVNVRCGFWPLARRAATDLGDLLAFARRRRLADPELCLRGSSCAFRIAELVAGEVQ
jgi:hypothetical protein